MADSEDADLICRHCEGSVTEADTYCPNCGSIFIDGLVCANHSSAEADGVCVICSKPFCKKCGKESIGVFLCDPHWQYEIQEGMARVYGCTDNVQAQFVTTTLEQSGYHPFLYSRKWNPGADLVAPGGIVRNYGNHPFVELKVLVPFAEVLNAEKTLSELRLTGEERGETNRS
jgi:hypothetical protein